MKTSVKVALLMGMASWLVVDCCTGPLQAKIPGPIPVAGRIYAIDVKTGQSKELFKAENTSLTSPAVHGGVLYVGRDATLCALDAQTGRELWTHKAAKTVYVAKPTEEAVFCGAGSNPVCAGPQNGQGPVDL